MLAVIAAMIRIASSPSRKTIIAAFVITVASLAPSPVFARASSSASSSTSRVSRISLAAVVGAISSREAVDVACAVPDQPLDLGDQGGVERAQLDLGAELEEGVGAQARLLGLLALARGDRGLHLVEADVDQVEVGLVVGLLPLLRKHPRRGSRWPRHAPPRPPRAGPPRRPRWRRRAYPRSSANAASTVDRPRRGRARPARARGRRAPPVAPSMNATASCSSNGIVTCPSSVPSSYSIGTRSRKRVSCAARRACSSGVNGAAVKPSRSVGHCVSRARSNSALVALQRGRSSAAKSAGRLARSAAPRCASYSGARISQ